MVDCCQGVPRSGKQSYFNIAPIFHNIYVCQALCPSLVEVPCFFSLLLPFPFPLCLITRVEAGVRDSSTGGQPISSFLTCYLNRLSPPHSARLWTNVTCQSRFQSNSACSSCLFACYPTNLVSLCLRSPHLIRLLPQLHSSSHQDQLPCTGEALGFSY